MVYIRFAIPYDGRGLHLINHVYIGHIHLSEKDGDNLKGSVQYIYIFVHSLSFAMPCVPLTAVLETLQFFLFDKDDLQSVMPAHALQIRSCFHKGWC